MYVRCNVNFPTVNLTILIANVANSFKKLLIFKITTIVVKYIFQITK